MQRLTIFLALAIIFSLLVLQGFSPVYRIPEYVDVDITQTSSLSPEKALDEVYFDISTIGIKPATKKSLEDDFYIKTDSFKAVWGRYTDGRFGINDLIIVLPAAGGYTSARQALEDIKLNRMEYFNGFDVYNAYNIASNGKITMVGEYIVLLMLEDNDRAIELLSKVLE